MKDWQRPYLRRFIIGMAGYVILLPASLWLIGSERITFVPLVIVVALIPVFPLIFAMAAVVGNARNEDELHRRIHFEAILITALLTGGLTFSYGLLEAAGLLPPLPSMVIAPFMIITWGIANAIIARRYQ